MPIRLMEERIDPRFARSGKRGLLVVGSQRWESFPRFEIWQQIAGVFRIKGGLLLGKKWVKYIFLFIFNIMK
jgi:hypothetical protein